MSEYRLNISGTIELSDYSNIYDYMSLVSMDDKLTITVDPGSAPNTEFIRRMLEDNDFVISAKGSHDNGQYYISAYRKRNGNDILY